PTSTTATCACCAASSPMPSGWRGSPRATTAEAPVPGASATPQRAATAVAGYPRLPVSARLAGVLAPILNRISSTLSAGSGRVLLSLALWLACLAPAWADEHVLVLGRISDDPGAHY